jgi:uroporphyrinogen decarboxylase
VNDRLLRACRLEPVDVTPVWFMRQAGRALPEYRAIRSRVSLTEIVADPALCAEVTLQPVRRLGVDGAILFADITTPLPGIGLEVDIVDGIGPVLARPVTSAADLDALRAFDAAEAVPGLLDAIRLLRRDLDVPLIGFAGAPFTLASYVVGGRASRDATAIVRLARSDPAVADRLLTTLADLAIAYLTAQVAAGVQVVQLFDSWAGALGPSDYARLVTPHNRRILASVAALGVPTIHFSTGTAGILEAVGGAGGDVIGVDWRTSLDDAWRRVPGRGIQGNLDPTVLLGPWSETERQAHHVLDEAAGRRGHVFNLGHGVLPATDPDDLARLVDLVHEHRLARAAA